MPVVKNSNPDPERLAAAQGLGRTFAASMLALCAGLVFIYGATDRGQAFTTETLRRAQVSRAPQPIPDFSLTDSAGRSRGLLELLATGKKVWIVDFVYTRCQTVCSSLGAIYQQLQAQILERGAQDQVGLLSISFDPQNDSPQSLRDYAARMRMNPDVWKIMTLTAPKDRQRLLDSFGIMVVPAPLGEFEHNAALHIVRPDGQLVRIMDYDAPAPAFNAALALVR